MATSDTEVFSSIKVKHQTAVKIRQLTEMMSNKLGHRVTVYDAVDMAITQLLDSTKDPMDVLKTVFA